MNVLFGTDLLRKVHKAAQVFLNSCTMTALENVEKTELGEFGKIQLQVEQREWINYTPIWVDTLPLPPLLTKEDGKWNSERIAEKERAQNQVEIVMN